MAKVTGRENVGETRPEMLVIGTKHPLDVCHVRIAAGQGKLVKGTVLGENDGGECCILGTDGYTAAYILAEDADGAEGENVVAPAYRCGDFNRGALKVKEGYKMTAADVTALRNGGIYLGNVM